ncbi:MAG: ADP-ribosylglycohydrolase family protein [Armatimonadetes bacterium]|nr:ADP-ribosylglycohydrolase family protein [Armatimonadota bacterium]
MAYFPGLDREFGSFRSWMDLRKEQGLDVSDIEKEVVAYLRSLRRGLESKDPPFGTKYLEPVAYKSILKARPKGPRSLKFDLTDEQLYDKMLGAWLGRGAGCVLGIPVEGWSRTKIQEWAGILEQPYPLAEYWRDTPRRGNHYSEPIINFLKGRIDHIGPDDDITYTVLGLLILEEYGLGFTSRHVGEAWVKLLPMACTAEHVALENLKKGLKPPKTALKDNPYMEWIGADIRSDPWGYAAPGLPEVAADFAYRDASVSHIMNGTYGEMFFSAAIAAAFVVNDPIECLRIGLTEIPAKCRLTETVKETLKWCRQDADWGATETRIAKKYDGMSMAHTLNNAALTVAGLWYGEGDLQKTISFTVMGGVDTDCTGATAGSIVGAILGARKLPKKWVGPFGDGLSTYIRGHEKQSISDLARRCCAVAKQVRSKFA